MTGSLASVNRMASSFAVGTINAMQEALSPKGILQHIINILTFGGVRRDNQEQYQAFVQSMADELEKPGYSRDSPLPEKITLSDFNGYKVEFSLPACSNSTGSVVITVSKNNELISETVSSEVFKKVCNTLMFRNEFSIHQHGIVLTEEGGMYLKGARLRGVSLEGEDLSYADLSRSEITYVNLSTVDLSHANLKSCCMTEIYMHGINLSGACLKEAVISEVNINWSTFVDANLERACLTQVVITGCNLTQSNMKDISFSRCALARSNLRCCNLSGAKIEHTKMTNVDLT